MFGNNKLIEQLKAEILARDRHLADLRAQVQDLRLLALPAKTSQHVPLVALEADAILSQREETITLSDEEIEERELEISERDRVLSGTY